MPTLADLLDAAISALADVRRGKSRWSDRNAYSVAGREFVHFHSPDEVDIRLTTRLQSQNKKALGADARVTFRRNRSEWITFSLRSPEDVEAALQWIRLGRDANRP
ncbi:MAG: luciferase family protein [Thermoplasmata archaeon]